MSQLSYAEKVEKLKQLSASNFTNRTMLMLTGAEDFLTQEKYKDDRYYIDMIYDIAMPELMANPEKPSKALTALAFNGALRPEDYQRLVDAGKKASAAELKEFLTQEVDHEPKEKVVNYLSFPMLAMMTQHVKPWEAVDILLLEPNLIKDCFSNTRSKTFKELMSENTYLLLRQKAPKELQEHLKIDDAILTSWGVSLDATNKEGKLVSSHLDRRTVQAVARWDDIRKARTAAHQTGNAAKIQQWLQNNRTRS